MSEKYILMGRGEPSIIERDELKAGTRLVPSEAREYAHRLLALADELDLADPAPTGDYRAARGAFNWQEGDEPAEQTIRRVRDGAPTEPDELQQAREAHEDATRKAGGDRLIQPLSENLNDLSNWLIAGHNLIAAQQQRIETLQADLEQAYAEINWLRMR